MQDLINDKKLILTTEFVQYDSIRINLNTINNFFFVNSKSTLNAWLTSASCILSIDSNDKNKTFTINTDVSCSLFGISNYKEEQIYKTCKLYQVMFPTLIRQYIIFSLKKLEKNNTISVANISFDKIGIQMMSKIGFVENVNIPYKFAEISGEFTKFGLLYSGGRAPLLEITDTNIGKTYRYSNNMRNQPSFGEISKAINLLLYIKENKLFEFNNTE